LQSCIHYKSPNKHFRVLIDNFLGIVVALGVTMGEGNHGSHGVTPGPTRAAVDIRRTTSNANKATVGVGRATANVMQV